MTRSRLALLLLGLSAAVAPAQPPAAPTPVPLVTRLLPYVEDENFGKELKLTPDQVKKFVEVRKKDWDAQYTTAPAEYRKGAADQMKAMVALFKEVLSADQYKRAVQLAAQNAWGSLRGGVAPGAAAVTLAPPDVTKAQATALRQYAELADPLNLTDEQKKLVAAGGNQFGRFAATVYLTAEQSKIAKELLGEPVKTGWNAAFDQRQNRFFGSIPQALSLTQAKDVRTEIAMTDEQVKALAPLLTKWQPLINGGGGGFPGGAGGQPANLSPEAQAKQNEELTAETEKALAATLKPEQVTRLREIEQQQVGGFGGFGGAPVTVPLSARLRMLAVRKALGVTDDQMKSLAAADESVDDAIAAAVAADESVDDAVKAVTAVHADHEKACAAVLTADQTKKLDEMMGKPFTGNSLPDVIGGLPTVLAMKMRAAMFGNRQLFELRLLAANKPIRDDLGLTPEQVKKVAEKESEATRKFGAGAGVILAAGDPALLGKAMTEQSEFVEKAIGDILTADQAKRYRELMLQRAEVARTRNQGAFNTLVGAVGVPGVAEAVKLTAEQKKKLLDDGAKPDDVLTADQKTAIQGMLGKKFEGNFNVGNGGFGPQNTAARTTADVLLNVGWDTFKLTPEQYTKLVPAANQYQLETMPAPVQGGQGPGVRFATPAVQAAANEKLTKAVAGILTPEQVKRVEQVRYQLIALTGSDYLTNAEVAKALALKDEQKAKIAAILADNQRLQFAARGTSPFNNFGGGGGGAWSQKLGEKTNARAMAVLTEEQKATWKALTGEPVPNLRPINQFGFPGGFGGGGFIGGGGFVPGGF